MNLSLFFIKKLKRKRTYYEMCSRKKKRLLDILSVPYMIIEYLTIIGFFYNLLFGLTLIIGWCAEKMASSSAISAFLRTWPGTILNFFFPIVILGYIFTLVMDVWVGDPSLFKTTFKYRVLRL